MLTTAILGEATVGLLEAAALDEFATTTDGLATTALDAGAEETAVELTAAEVELARSTAGVVEFDAEELTAVLVALAEATELTAVEVVLTVEVETTAEVGEMEVVFSVEDAATEVELAVGLATTEV